MITSEEGKVPLTIKLPGELARRLQLAAEARKQPPATLVIELLARHLPNPDAAAAKKKIPYT